MFDDTVTQGWIAQPGPIAMRRAERVPTTSRDIAAARGILLAALIGANVCIWLYALLA